MSLPTLGVVIVSFNASTELLDCLESLLAAPDVALHVVVVDNASSDDTVARFEDWASGKAPYAPPEDLPFALPPAAKPLALVDATAKAPSAPQITLIRSAVNLGFAGGVNLGLACLAANPAINRFWVLNPDSVVAPETPHAFATYQGELARFSLMGGRVTYVDPPDRIQSDGGIINYRTGVTSNLNQGRNAAQTPPPRNSFDFISGASMVASRAFYETAGPLPEEYFLYYEEVDWALRRGDLPLVFCPEARVYHRVGSSIGSRTMTRVATPFSTYFLYRARMMFLRRYAKGGLAGAWAYALAKAGQLALKGYRAEAAALLAGSWGGAPPKAIRARLSPEAARLAFDKAAGT